MKTLCQGTMGREKVRDVKEIERAMKGLRSSSERFVQATHVVVEGQ